MISYSYMNETFSPKEAVRKFVSKKYKSNYVK